MRWLCIKLSSNKSIPIVAQHKISYHPRFSRIAQGTTTNAHASYRLVCGYCQPHSVFPLKVGIPGKYHVKKPEYHIQIPENYIKTVQYTCTIQNHININALPTKEIFRGNTVLTVIRELLLVMLIVVVI